MVGGFSYLVVVPQWTQSYGRWIHIWSGCHSGHNHMVGGFSSDRGTTVHNHMVGGFSYHMIVSTVAPQPDMRIHLPYDCVHRGTLIR
jgi:hypothetical protein